MHLSRAGFTSKPGIGHGGWGLGWFARRVEMPKQPTRFGPQKSFFYINLFTFTCYPVLPSAWMYLSCLECLRFRLQLEAPQIALTILRRQPQTPWKHCQKGSSSANKHLLCGTLPKQFGPGPRLSLNTESHLFFVDFRPGPVSKASHPKCSHQVISQP